MDSIDWTAPATEVHDALVERYCELHPEYTVSDDEFAAANEYADEQIWRNLK